VLIGRILITLQKYLPSEWVLLKRFSRSEVKHQENIEMKGIMCYIYLFVCLVVIGNDCVIAKYDVDIDDCLVSCVVVITILRFTVILCYHCST